MRPTKINLPGMHYFGEYMRCLPLLITLSPAQRQSVFKKGRRQASSLLRRTRFRIMRESLLLCIKGGVLGAGLILYSVLDLVLGAGLDARRGSGSYILYIQCVPSLSLRVQFCTSGNDDAAVVLVRWTGALSCSSEGRCRHALPAAVCVVQTLVTDAPFPRIDSVGHPSAPARSGEDFVTMTLPPRGMAGRADAAKAWRRAVCMPAVMA